MKVSYQWLSEVVDLQGVSPTELGERLTQGGLTVDGVIPRVDTISGVIVGEVVTCDQHPNADRLHVCQVNVGQDELLTIVCGAPNVAAGQHVPTAVVGAMLPGGKIGKAKLRGVESQGMLCSAKEIGLETKLLPKEQTEGLYILPESAPIGADVVKLLQLDDTILDIDLTPNRSDCLSIRGLAYEIAALYERELTFSLPERTKTGQDSPVQVSIETDRCSRYDAQVLSDLSDGPSPLWMQMRLLSMGVRPISAIVDVTNYVMLEWGQPLHAFDLDEVHQQHIVVRQARSGEMLITLDGEERALNPDMIVIADPDRAIGLAGVMGGENTEVTPKTHRVILESAAFDAPSVRRTGQRLGLRSEAQQRFEKGIDVVAIRAALNRATELYAELCGATVVGDAVSASQSNAEAGSGVAVEFSPERCRELLGAEIDDEAMAKVFARLGFTISKEGGSWVVNVPSRRPDITRDADLVEEVARLVGYDQIPSTLPTGPTTTGTQSLRHRIHRLTRHVLIETGMSEVFTYAFTHPSKLHAMRLPDDSPLRDMIPLAMPLSDERTVMRTHLLPSLAQIGAYNLAHGNGGGQVFEIARVYHPLSLPMTEQPRETTMWAGLWFGLRPATIGERARAFDFYDAKGCIESWLESFGLLSTAVFTRAEIPYLHPLRSAVVKVGDTVIGHVGQLYPDTAEKMEVPGAIYAEFNLDDIESLLHLRFHVRSLPRFPASLRDLSVVVRQGVAAADMLQAARDEVAASGELANLLESLEVFDVYQGKGIAQGHQSIAFSFVYRAPDRTLTDEEVSALEEKVLARWKNDFEAALRA
ncbi:phenylalanine--tRNA ligase subunit beta [Alicyclobacillus curvatus]|nr:phenylalanine--tRNA ligase subunit beta [Alicyclobacillus curvatus]